MNVLVAYKSSVFELYGSSDDMHTRTFVAKNNSLKANHDAHCKTLESVLVLLEQEGHDVCVKHRANLSQENGEYDLAIAVGGDGTLLDLSHYLRDVPILGINSSPNSSVGFYCATNAQGAAEWIRQYPHVPSQRVSRLVIERENGAVIKERALNDVLYAHASPAAMSRYEVDGVALRGSGLLVATAGGSSAFMLEEGGELFDFERDQFEYLHRGRRDKCPLYANEITLRSLTRQGKLWIDGEYVVHDMALGETIKIRLGDPLNIIGNLANKQKRFIS